MGRSREDDLGPGRRTFSVNNYLIYYRIKPDLLEILRVLHASRDAQAVLKEDQAQATEPSEITDPTASASCGRAKTNGSAAASTSSTRLA